jgi:hypothetical protein
MKFSKTLTTCILTFFLIACDRQDYVTWKCTSNPANSSLSFILDGSKMKINQKELSFCGSYGSNSFFDAPCPAQATEGRVKLNPKLGILLFEDSTYQCQPL